MKTKMFFGNQYVGSFNCDGKTVTKFQIFKQKIKILTKRTLTSLAIISVVGWSVYSGSIFFPKKVYADKEVIKEVEIQAPVMDRIAKCESNNQHLAPNGQVLIKVNNNGTTDIGVMQINSVWFAKATMLGYNLTLEKDNRSFASYLYNNFGTEPWYSSKSCWSK